MLGAAIRRGLRRRLPILTWLPRYSRKQLRRDLIAGAIVVALAVPQSLGYAAIAGVPVQVGLYAVPIALAAYAVFGTSPQLIVGPVSTISVLSGTLVVALGPRDVREAMTYTSAIALPLEPSLSSQDCCGSAGSQSFSPSRSLPASSSGLPFS